MSEQKREASARSKSTASPESAGPSSASSVWIGALIVIVCVLVGAGCNLGYFTDKVRHLARHLQLVSPVVDNVQRTLAEPAHFLAHGSDDGDAPWRAESRKTHALQRAVHTTDLLNAGARQHWRCRRCGDELDASFTVRRGRAVCEPCAIAMDDRHGDQERE